MLLNDPLDDASLRLLRLIYHGSGGGTGDWPVWQWVAGQAAQHGLDAEAVLRGLPEWQLSYRPVRGIARGVGPQPEDRLALTVHGLAQVNDAVLLPAFLAALAEASEARAGHVTTPQEVRPIVLGGPDLLPTVRTLTGYRGDEHGLHALLAGEPATWFGHTEPAPGRSWSWDLTRVGLQHFGDVQTAEQYLERLEFLVGWPLPAPPAAPPLPPLALPEALDHLDAHWRLRTGNRLLVARRLEVAATLALPVTSAAELQTAYSALADVLGGLEPGGPPAERPGSLNQLEQRLVSVVDADDLPVARSAVSTLRQLVQLRVGLQHSGSQAFRQSQGARRALSLPPVPDDSEAEWEVARQACVAALRDLRAAVATSEGSAGST